MTLGTRLPITILLAMLLALAVLPLLESKGTSAQTTSSSLEQQLAEQYAPIVMIKKQTQECSSDGEQFRPVSVDILFGTDDVRLMKKGHGGLDTDTEVKRTIQASDLYRLGEDYYLDLPGEPRNPGCVYEKWGQARMTELGLEPSLYARVATNTDTGTVVVQYWYYWVFNLFNNTHESDWEGIQLVFTAGSVQQILDEDLLPSTIAFAQHDGGEQGDWQDEKVETQGTHIVSHPSSGSHADYYGSAVWLGWGENGSGFGCDFSDPPEEELPVHIILLPNEISDLQNDFAWLTYTGRWGQRGEPSMFSGPTGPNTKPRWDQPVEWGEEIRGNSLPVPVRPTIGPEISRVFCGAASFGASIVRIFPVDPKIILAVGSAVMLGLAILAALAWHSFARAVRLYFRHGYFFITVGVLAFPIAWAGQWLEDHLEKLVQSRTDALAIHSRASRGIYSYLLHTGLGGIQEILLACLVAPVVIFATWEITRSEFPGFERTWQQGVRDFPRVFLATLSVAVLLTLMALSVVLLPLVVYKGVKWFFAPQAVVIDHIHWRDARHVSADRMTGHWIRAATIVVAAGAISGLPGPLIGTLTLVLHIVDLTHAQWISAVIYCVLYPIALIMSTLFYLQRSTAPGLATPYVAPAPVTDSTATATAPA